MMKLNSIIKGNCVDVLKECPDNFFELTITSPPYDNLRRYRVCDFNYEDIANILYRVTKPGGIVVWVVGDGTEKGSETLTSFKQALYFNHIGFRVHDTMIYQKANFSMPSKNRYHQIFEYVFIFSKGQPKTFNPIMDRETTQGHRLGINTKRQVDGTMAVLDSTKGSKPYNKYGMRYNLWRIRTAGQEQMCKALDHPAMFPEALARDHIISWSNPGDTVLDPMCGSGTTCVAAMKLDRNYVGIDISQEYCDLAEKRINNLNE